MEENKLKSIYEEVLNNKFADISELQKLDLDSLDLANVLFQIETDLKVKVSDEEALKHKLEKVENMFKYLKSLRISDQSN